MSDENPTDPTQYDPTVDYDQHYLLNDALCPAPRSGPRVVVGFWAVDPETFDEGAKPEVPEEPMFTITYPVGRGRVDYNWKHVAPEDESHPIHPNSARNIEWIDGYLYFEQSTEFGCRPNLETLAPAAEKTAHWELFNDFPPYLWGRIVATHELADITIRENCGLNFRAADGHYIGSGPSGDVECGRRTLHERCNFRARFPNFEWGPEGGSGDGNDQPFCLQASDGQFLRLARHTGGATLRADAQLERAARFKAVITVDGMISLATEDGLTLQHNPPYGALEMKPTTEADETWAWFAVSYI